MALIVTGRSAAEPLASLFLEAGEAMRRGEPLEDALPETGPLGALAAVFRRSAVTGSAVSEQLAAIADELRTDAHFERLERARRAEVLAALPLGVCLLPAFLLLAVVPTVIGLGGSILR